MVGILMFVLMWILEEDRAFERKKDKCLGSYTILQGVGVRILEWIGCTKCIIYTISLVVKWVEL